MQNVSMLSTPNKNFCEDFFQMDRSIRDDFVGCVSDSREEASVSIKKLDSQDDTDEQINRLFRTLHSLKGNCRMVCLDPFADTVHHVESVMSLVRSHQLDYLPEMGEFLSLFMEEIEALLNELIQNRGGCEDGLTRLSQIAVSVLDASSQEGKYEKINQAIHSLKGVGLAPSELPSSVGARVQKVPEDTEFMRNLSGYIDEISIYRRGRSDQLIRLLELFNAALSQPIDVSQLRAAGWMHDVGMGFVPHSIFNKEGALTREEIKVLHQHAIIGFQLLSRLGGWDEAAIIVLDHHERFDGQGYPNKLSGSSIHLGARMMSIVDTFCSITTERSDRSYKKSLLSAVSEINANSGSQFDPELVEIFNQVVKENLMKR